MKTLKKSLIALFILMGVVIWLSPIHLVECATNPVISISNPSDKDKVEIRNLCETVNESLNEVGLFSDKSYLDYTESGDVVNIEIAMTSYNKLSQENKQKTIQIALDETYNSDVSRTNKNKIYKFITNTDKSTSSLVRQLSNDVTADFAGAYSSFKPFSGVLGWILGVVSLGMFILIGLTIVVDLSYINLPFVQLMLGDTVKGNKPKFVSLEAWNAVKESESKAGVEYKSPLGLYLHSKTKQFIALFICLLYLVSGELYNVIAKIMDYFSGLIG